MCMVCHWRYGHTRAAPVTDCPGFCDAATRPVELTSTSRANAARRTSQMRIVKAGTPGAVGVTSPFDRNVMPAAAGPTAVTVLVPASAWTLCSGTQAAPPQSALLVSTTIHPPDQGAAGAHVVPPADGHTVMPVGEASLTASLRA